MTECEKFRAALKGRVVTEVVSLGNGLTIFTADSSIWLELAPVRHQTPASNPERSVKNLDIPHDLEHLSELYADSFMHSFPVAVPEEHRLGLVKTFDAHQARIMELLRREKA